MSQQRHELPTHLNVEDKAFVGLSVRQLMNLIVGLSTAYAIWNDWPSLPLPVRATLAGACLLAALALTLVRPGGRPLEEWAFVALHYLATPKTSVWRPREVNSDAIPRLGGSLSASVRFSAAMAVSLMSQTGTRPAAERRNLAETRRPFKTNVAEM